MVSFDETIDYLRDMLVYSFSYLPSSYPPEDNITWSSEYEEMHKTLVSLLQRCRSQDK